MTTPAQPSAAGTDGIVCEYRELHGANIYCAESVLVCRVVFAAIGGLAGTLERPSSALDSCVELLEALELSAAEIRERERWPLASLLQTITEQLVRRVGMATGAPVPAAAADPERELVLTMPSGTPVRASCELAARLVSASASAPAAQQHERLRGLLDDFDRRHPALWQQTTALVAACRQRDIPWRRFPGFDGYMQLGEGALQARTDRVSSEGRTAIELASDKTACSQLLARHGMPVASHIALADAAGAWEAATRLGVPVVVKPRWMDYGTAVSVGLRTRAEVEEAFHRAQKLGPWVLVERFIPGDDYRVLVAGGRFINAVRRLPAAVVGDGRRTIGGLLDEANADPRRSPGDSPLYPIVYDEDSERLLRAQGWTLASVPAAGAEVRLKSAANWKSGGSWCDVSDRIHPDNVELCVRAIALCGVEVGGADFLTTDISRSFRKVGGALCEVNVLPSLDYGFVEGSGDPNVLGEVLDALYAGRSRWRVPTVVVCGAAADVVGRAVVAELEARWTVGYAGLTQTTIAGWPVAGNRPVHVAHHLLTEDPSTEAVVVAVTAEQVLEEGVGIAKADVVALVDRDPPAAGVRDVLAKVGAQILLTSDAAVIAELLAQTSKDNRAR